MFPVVEGQANGVRYAPHGSAGYCVSMGGIGHHPGALPGRGNATLPEPTSSHANFSKTRREASHHASPGALPGCGTLCLASLS